MAHRRFLALALAIVCSASLSAQAARGTIAGVVTKSGELVPTADVEARDAATGAVYKATTGNNGRYTLAVPAGTYEVSVLPLGFSADRTSKGDQVVAAGRTTTVDIAVTVGNDNVIGDDAAFIAIRKKYADLKGPLPRAGRKPDLSGVWNANVDPNPPNAALQPWAEAVMKQRMETEFRDLPSASCLPDDPAWTTPLLYKIIHTPTLLVFLTEGEPHYRQIFLDGRAHPKDLDPTWLGHSIGRWEGDTLVVDTVGFNDKAWLTLAGLPHTDQLHIVERFQRRDIAHMTHEVTMEDPGAFTKPHVWKAEWQLAPGEEIMESLCAENNKYHENMAPR